MTSYTYPGVTVTENLNPLVDTTAGVPAGAIQAFALPYNIGPSVPVLVTSWQQFTRLYGNFSVANGSYLHYAVYQYFNNGGNACYVLRMPNTDATASSLVLVDIKTGTPDNVMTVSAQSPGAWGNSLEIEVIAAGSSTTTAGGYYNLNVYNTSISSTVPVESFVSLTMNPADPRYVASIVNSPVAGSNYITVAVSLPTGGYVAGTTDLAPIAATALSGGADGSAAPVIGTAIPAAFAGIQNNHVLNLNVPGWTNTTDLNNLITWANNNTNIMIYVDGPAPSGTQTSAQVATTYINMVTGGSVLNASQYAALYGPWLLIQDPASSVAGATRYVPACGAVLGVTSSTDTLAGVQQSAAGTTYGGVEALALQTNFSAADLTNLEVAQINPIKAVPGAGFCVYGARTLHPGYPNRYVAVQRVLMQVAHDAVSLTNFAVFAPNDPNLWEQIATILSNYLNNLYTSGVIGGGGSASDAYLVTCDATNNTPQSAQAGIVNVSLAVALLSPAEFITINISQLASGNATISTS